MRSPDGRNGEEDDHVLEAEAGSYELELAQAVFFAWETFGDRWYRDALAEVADEDAPYFEQRDTVRRQVVFATCALESWFFEWVHDELLEQQIKATKVLAGYPTFPDRVKGVMREIGARGGLARPFECGESSEWDDMIYLLRMRNGLVHAGASRVSGNLPEGVPAPEPSGVDFQTLAPAEPIRIVRDVAEFLMSFADAEPPAWMEVPGEHS